jgi:hypothetical protein
VLTERRRNSTVTTICGMPPDQVVEMVRLAAAPSLDFSNMGSASGLRI